MLPIHFLSAADGTRLTKRFDIEDGRIVKHPYPQVASFTSDARDIETLEDFFVQLVAYAQYGHCLLKGQLDRPLKNESRAGHTDSETPTQWLVLDNDNLHHLEPQTLMDLLGLGDVDYMVQYSASAGIEAGKRGYHIFFLLDSPWYPADLKRVLRGWNLDHPEIRQHFQLSRTNNSLRWPLDISVCQNDKLIYIAPPTLGPGVNNALEGDRIRLVNRSKRLATLIAPTESDDLLRQREQALINQLREQAGLERKTFETRVVKGEMVAVNADRAEITGRKEERGFVYLNLNGGDSWGYYHPIGSSEILFNFKGEPNYLIEDLLPEYYPVALERAQEARSVSSLEDARADMELQARRLREAEDTGGRALMAFRDKQEDRYYVGWIDPGAKDHELHAIGTKDRIKDHFKQHGERVPEIIPSVDYRFDPTKDALYDLEQGFINRYKMPPYRKNARRRENAAIPPVIHRVIEHALGGDRDTVEHFLNWLAVLFIYRERTQTAWILQGTTGTGKGLLFSQILRPLIGEDYCRLVNLANLEEQFNGFAAETLLLLVDEVDTDQVSNGPKLTARLKSWITEPKLPVRAMRQDLREVPNHLNLMLSSNQPNSMRIEANDRRFNVAPRQESKLLAPPESGEQLVEQIKSELQDFADYLMSREADVAMARQALDNEPKRLLQAVTQTAIEEVARAFREGNLGFFLEHRPDDRSISHFRLPIFNGGEIFICPRYSEFVEDALKCAAKQEKHVVRHESLFAVFELLVGDMPKTKTKLSKRLGHQNLNVMPHAQASKSTRGLGVKWSMEPEEAERWKVLLTEERERQRAPIPVGRERPGVDPVHPSADTPAPASEATDERSR